MTIKGGFSWPTDQQTPPSQSSSPLFCFLLLPWPKEAGPAVQVVAVEQVPRAQRGVQAALLAQVPRAEELPRAAATAAV